MCVVVRACAAGAKDIIWKWRYSSTGRSGYRVCFSRCESCYRFFWREILIITCPKIKAIRSYFYRSIDSITSDLRGRNTVFRIWWNHCIHDLWILILICYLFVVWCVNMIFYSVLRQLFKIRNENDKNKSMESTFVDVFGNWCWY